MLIERCTLQLCPRIPGTGEPTEGVIIRFALHWSFCHSGPGHNIEHNLFYKSLHVRCHIFDPLGRR